MEEPQDPGIRRQPSLHRSQELMAFVAIGSRLAFRLAMVLLVLEVVAGVANGTTAGRVLDGVALVATGFVLWASTQGVHLVLRWLEARVRAAHPGGRLW